MDLVKNICEKVCAYYKPSKDESLACRGFLVLKELLENGKKISCDKPDGRARPLTEESLGKVLCLTCPFYEGDCDFVLRKGDAMPCGGFIYLGLLIERGMISLDDIRDIE